VEQFAARKETLTDARIQHQGRRMEFLNLEFTIMYMYRLSYTGEATKAIYKVSVDDDRNNDASVAGFDHGVKELFSMMPLYFKMVRVFSMLESTC
jgi:hypothetical protein